MSVLDLSKRELPKLPNDIDVSNLNIVRVSFNNQIILKFWLQIFVKLIFYAILLILRSYKL